MECGAVVLMRLSFRFNTGFTGCAREKAASITNQLGNRRLRWHRVRHTQKPFRHYGLAERRAFL